MEEEEEEEERFRRSHRELGKERRGGSVFLGGN